LLLLARDTRDAAAACRHALLSLRHIYAAAMPLPLPLRHADASLLSPLLPLRCRAAAALPRWLRHAAAILRCCRIDIAASATPHAIAIAAMPAPLIDYAAAS